MKSRAKKYTPDYKLKIVNYAIHTNITQASYIFEVTRKSVSKWLKLYRKKGYEGLLERKKREDEQPKKLTEIILESISRIRLESPNITLNDIKKQYDLDCSLVLISRKLKEFFEGYFKVHQRLIVTFRMITPGKSRKKKKRIYQFNIYDCMNNRLYFGFGEERNVKNLCIFISHIIEGMKVHGLIVDNAYVSTNLKYLKQLSCGVSHYDENIYSKYNLPLVVENNRHFIRGKINKLSYSDDEKDLIISAYEDMILNSDNIRFIQPLITDCAENKGYLYSLVKLNSTEVLKETMLKIEEYGNNAMISFDFDAAHDFFNKIYLTSIEGNDCEWHSIKLDSMYKMLSIHYHFKDYKRSRTVIEDILISPNVHKLKSYGDVYNLLGLICFYENKRDESDRYFSKSNEIFLDKSKKDHIFDFYRVNIRKYINRKNYREALVFSNKYVRTATSHKDELELCRAFDMKGVVYYFSGNMTMSEKCFKKQLELAEKISDYTEEAKAINNLLSVITYTVSTKKEIVENHIERMKELALIIKKEYYLYEAFQFSANFNCNTGNYQQAIIDYREVVNGCIKYFDMYNIVRNLFYLAYSYYNLNDTDNAIKYLKEVCAYSNDSDVEYHSSALNYLGRIYLDNGDLNKSIKYYNLAKRSAGHDTNNYIVADSLKSIGIIYEKKENFKSSFNFYKRALSSFRKQSNKSSMEIITDNITFIKEKIALISELIK
ncbi:MAG: tetratricopeptide repeat protein [Candidatus Delongbacteria bacterium]|nr:tetratricopeptide repeat protein [Candidatus Delongbacteria bacterium]